MKPLMLAAVAAVGLAIGSFATPQSAEAGGCYRGGYGYGPGPGYGYNVGYGVGYGRGYGGLYAAPPRATFYRGGYGYGGYGYGSRAFYGGRRGAGLYIAF